MKAKTWFEAQGRRAVALGLSLNYGRVNRYKLPLFAQQAYVRGFLAQSRNYAALKETP